jgi:hypothetical protein
MSTEVLWVVKKLTIGEISFQSAGRILRALELLQRSEESKSIQRWNQGHTGTEGDANLSAVVRTGNSLRIVNENGITYTYFQQLRR